MKTIVAIILIIVAVIIIRMVAKARKKKRENSPAEKLLNEQIETLRAELTGRAIFLDYQNDILFDEHGDIIETPRIHLNFRLHRSSITSSVMPIKISNVGKCTWSDRYDIEIDISLRDDPYEFEICYCGYHDAIAKSKVLGDVYLRKSKYLLYEVGKRISIQFIVMRKEESFQVIAPKLNAV